jgi:hypothetical protein
LYIVRTASLSDVFSEAFVWYASRTRISSRGYVRRTEETPENAPHTKNRPGVRFSGDDIRTCTPRQS